MHLQLQIAVPMSSQTTLAALARAMRVLIPKIRGKQPVWLESGLFLEFLQAA
jgi:hypothetical protein